ncbi:MAG: methyltransferase domain-containing protein [Candidatus Omnitrophica bacterium]|nr:methyltransferase domain-containing protein [Candidatus Omnitrophota bacterium]
MASEKRNYLLEQVVAVVVSGPQGKVLDLGCGNGRTGKMIADRGFPVEACDMDSDRFEFHNVIPFRQGNLDSRLPYDDQTFDCVILMEVIEHVYNPGFVIGEISRILKPGGRLVLSTPNILNISSRLRFLFEGSFDFFREPTLDYAKCFPVAIQNMHVIPWRYQDLEYLLARNGLEAGRVLADKRKMALLFPLLLVMPMILIQSLTKVTRGRAKGGVDYVRMSTILLSPDMLLGRHLIVESIKKAPAIP